MTETRLPDLDSRSEIHDLVVAFYREIIFDEVLGPIFDEVAEVDWAVHIPTLIDFWCRVLLGEPGYDGAILAAHQRVHDLHAFRPEHFERWFALWTGTITEGWSGPYADRAIDHAARVAGAMSHRLTGDTWCAPGHEPRSRPVGPATEVPQQIVRRPVDVGGVAAS